MRKRVVLFMRGDVGKEGEKGERKVKNRAKRKEESGGMEGFVVWIRRRGLFFSWYGGWRSSKGPSQKNAYRHISVASDHGSL